MAFIGGFEPVDDFGPEAQELKRQNLIDAYVREYDGAIERGFNEKAEQIADILEEEYDVDIERVEETRHPKVQVERVVPAQEQVERVVAPPAKKTTAKRGVASQVRGQK